MAVEEADARRILGAWRSRGRDVPPYIENLVQNGRLTEAAIETVEAILTRERIAGWRMNYTFKGPPYSAALFVRKKNDFQIVHEYQSSKLAPSLAASFIEALNAAYQVK